jgi:hypothetical protein
MTMQTAPLFLIGQNSRGQWIAQKQSGRCGGLFISQAAALKFALLENGNRREAVITVPGVLELEMGERTFALVHSADVATVSAPRPVMPSRPAGQPVLTQAA